MSQTQASPGANISVHARKFDGRLHRQWQARLVSASDTLIVVEGAFDEEIRHPELGTIAPGTLSAEYYWTNRCYSVFRFREPEGALRNYYCNINLPPAFDGSTLTFIDLDVDVLVAPDFSYRVLDEEEFAQNAVRYAYPPQVRETVANALHELLRLIERRDFPFDCSA